MLISRKHFEVVKGNYQGNALQKVDDNNYRLRIKLLKRMEYFLKGVGVLLVGIPFSILGLVLSELYEMLKEIVKGIVIGVPIAFKQDVFFEFKKAFTRKIRIKE